MLETRAEIERKPKRHEAQESNGSDSNEQFEGSEERGLSVG
jgi:hypothetical protein